ncbi:MAG: hypothetical protein J6S87_02840, partial [Bacteroidales bacterium]|nr:hypothetical protein [Bacteroidales bacterium]
YTLANVGQMELQDLSQEDEVFRSVFEDSMHQKLTKMEKEEYKKSVLEYEDVQKAVQYAREQGLEQGRADEKRLFVRNMLAEGFDPLVIAKITGLTEEEICALSRTY